MYYDPTGHKGDTVIHLPEGDYYPEEIPYLRLGQQHGKAIEDKVSGVKGSMNDNLGQYFDTPAVNNIRLNVMSAIIRLQKDGYALDEYSEMLQNKSLSPSKRKDIQNTIKLYLGAFNKDYSTVSNYGLTIDGYNVVKDSHYYTALATVYFAGFGQQYNDLANNEYFAPFQTALDITQTAQSLYMGIKLHSIMLNSNPYSNENAPSPSRNSKGAYENKLDSLEGDGYYSHNTVKPTVVERIDTANGMGKFNLGNYEERTGNPYNNTIQETGNSGVGGANKIFSPVEFKGTSKVGGKVRDISRRVYQRNDIDWNYVNPETGMSNLEWSKLGNAPIGKDGLPIELHHLLQEEAGPMAEALNSVHGKGQKILHGLRESGQSFRNNPVLEKQYNNFRKQYWKWRSNDAGTGLLP